jgi:hypothetical protein
MILHTVVEVNIKLKRSEAFDLLKLKDGWTFVASHQGGRRRVGV